MEFLSKVSLEKKVDFDIAEGFVDDNHDIYFFTDEHIICLNSVSKLCYPLVMEFKASNWEELEKELEITIIKTIEKIKITIEEI